VPLVVDPWRVKTDRHVELLAVLLLLDLAVADVNRNHRRAFIELPAVRECAATSAGTVTVTATPESTALADNQPLNGCPVVAHGVQRTVWLLAGVLSEALSIPLAPALTAGRRGRGARRHRISPVTAGARFSPGSCATGLAPR
jgi:hypothetical protein